MRRSLMHAVGVLAIVGSLAYVARPAPHVPPYDANLVRLAETELEGYCAGETFWKSQARGDAQLAASCRAEHASAMSSEVDLMKVEGAFCRGIIEGGWAGAVPECLNILATYQYWPTYDGNISAEWNRARPYPRLMIQVPAQQEDDSRTGDRQAPTRGGPAYVPPATNTVPPETETDTEGDTTTTEEEETK